MKSKLTSREIIAACHELMLLSDCAVLEDEGREEIAQLDARALATLTMLGEEVPEKLRSLRAVVIRLGGEATMLRAEARSLTERARRIEREVDRVRGYGIQILIAQREAGLPATIKTEAGTFYLSTHKRLVGPDHISPWIEFGHTKTETKPDRAAAKKALEAGETHPDFTIEAREVLNWR